MARRYNAGFFPQQSEYYEQQPFYPYSPQYANGNYQQQRNSQVPVKKKSGAKEVKGQTKEGNPYFGISAWFYRKNVGMVQINAFANSRSTEFSTQAGRTGISLMFEVFYKNTGIKRLEVATYFYDSGKAFLKDLGIVVSTKARNGGYAGYFSKK